MGLGVRRRRTADEPDRLVWWRRSQPIRNTAEILAHIKILLVKHPHLYQKLAQKTTELHLLGMSYKKIGKILGIDPKTAIKAVMSSHRIRLRKNVFEIYVKESTIG